MCNAVRTAVCSADCRADCDPDGGDNGSRAVVSGPAGLPVLAVARTEGLAPPVII